MLAESYGIDIPASELEGDVTAAMFGVPDENASISPLDWLIKEIRVTAALAYFHEEFEMTMGMIADGRVETAPLHTSTVGLATLEAAIADLAGGSSTQMKVLVDPRRQYVELRIDGGCVSPPREHPLRQAVRIG